VVKNIGDVAGATNMSLSKSPAVTLAHCTGASRCEATVSSTKVLLRFISNVGRPGKSVGHRPVAATPLTDAVELIWM
jgi:hypothetical protein